MSLYPQYLKETLNLETIELAGGFVSYALRPPVCHIEEAYIAPEFRQSSLALKLFKRVREEAKQAGCEEFQTQVLIHRLGSERALRWNLALGFKMIRAQNDAIIMARKVEG